MSKRNWNYLITLGCLLAFSLFLAFSASAEKIAVVDTAKVFKEYEKTKDAKLRLEKEIEDKRLELAKKNEKVEKMKTDLETQKGVISEAKYKKLEEKYQTERDLLREEYKEMQSGLMRENQTLMENIINDIKAICAEIAKDEKCDLVLDKESVLYYNGKDITYKVLDRLNK